MKATRVVAVSTFGILFLGGSAKAQSQDMSIDFTMRDSGVVGFDLVRGSYPGHAVTSKGRIRIDMGGPARNIPVPGFADSGAISTIYLDSGRTVVYLNSKTKKYTQFNPFETIDNLQSVMRSVGATMDVTFTGDPKVEYLGEGPVILGYKTKHFRLTMGLKFTTTLMGRRTTSENWSVFDEYIAPELGHMPDPFREAASLTGGRGTFNKLYFESIKRLRAKIGKGIELRGDVLSTTTDSHGKKTLRTIREVTRIERITASNDLFKIPVGYTRVEFPFGAAVPKKPAR